MVIGVDFDNTLINYDDVFFRRAADLGLIDQGTILNKKQVRDRIRLLPDGENLWQQLQAYVYTQGVAQAHLINGVKDFFISCKQAKIKTYIVSHKTINLRVIALDWMTANGFFDPAVLGLDRTEVYFESTRVEKIERIKTLGCTHFIDDLEEVFLDRTFPAGVEKILYASQAGADSTGDMQVINSWRRIHEYLFN